jgi:Flp pilus assembly protein TadB
MLDLIGAMLGAGASVEQALGVLADSCPAPVGRRLLGVRGALELGAGWTAAWDAGPTLGAAADRRSLEELRTALGFAVATGAPSAAIVHARAEQLRRRQNRSQEKRAAALGVRLVVPLGVCALPAFACLGVVPVVLALLPFP